MKIVGLLQKLEKGQITFKVVILWRDIIECETKRDENMIIDIAENLGLVSSTNMITKEEL